MSTAPDAWVPDLLSLTLGQRLGLALDNAGMTIGDLAEAIEMSRETVSLWRNDHDEPRKEKYWGEVAAALGCDYNWLRYGRPTPPKGGGGQRKGLKQYQVKQGAVGDIVLAAAA